MERDETVLKAIPKLNFVTQNNRVAVIKGRVLWGILLKQRIAKNSIFQCHFEVLSVQSIVYSCDLFSYSQINVVVRKSSARKLVTS